MRFRIQPRMAAPKPNPIPEQRKHGPWFVCVLFAIIVAAIAAFLIARPIAHSNAPRSSPGVPSQVKAAPTP